MRPRRMEKFVSWQSVVEFEDVRAGTGLDGLSGTVPLSDEGEAKVRLGRCLPTPPSHTISVLAHCV